MNKNIFRCLVFAAIAWGTMSCNDSQSDLLESKVYFENTETIIEVKDTDVSLNIELGARVSTMVDHAVTLQYGLGDAALVDAYNLKFGTQYEAFNPQYVVLNETETSIHAGKIYADKVIMQLSHLDQIEAGKKYLLPVRITSSSMAIVSGSDLCYYIINKPLQIKKVTKINNSAILVPIPNEKEYQSLTYEALVRIDRFNDNNTIMGHEGVLIFRIGDEGGGLDRHILQIAGNKQFQIPDKLTDNKWYHLAFSYDQPSGFAAIYINGAKVAEGTWDTKSFKLGGDGAKGNGFFIGKVDDFMWGTRPFNGLMSEVRLWSVARTENQIKQNMLTVDPKSEGLECYYKLNGEDHVVEGGLYKVKDASGHMDGIVKQRGEFNMVELTDPVEIK